MTCKHFLETHSEYMDGVLASDEVGQCRAHIEGCASCARYDRVVRKGVQLLTALPRLEASADLVHDVHRRTAALEREPRTDGLSWAVGIAAMLAAVAWSPMLRTVFEGDSVRPSAAVIDAHPTPVADVFTYHSRHADVRFSYVQAPWTWQGSARTDVQSVEVLASGPYSPLTVDPPAYHAAPPPARAVWMALHPDE